MPSNPPPEIWAFYAPEIADDHSGATIVAHETVQHGGAHYVLASIESDLAKLVASAFSEGFGAGMDEYTKSLGGVTWEGSRSKARLDALTKGKT